MTQLRPQTDNPVERGTDLDTLTDKLQTLSKKILQIVLFPCNLVSSSAYHYTKRSPRMDKIQVNNKKIPAANLSSGYKQDSVFEHCLIMIATGKWAAGARMPSVRDAEKEWGINRLAIQQAYKKLESQGLIVSKARSGYYVTNQENILKVSNFRVELDNLHRTFAEQIMKTTGLAPLPAFRYLARLAQVRDKEAPMCAFAECTHIQAESLAGEVADQLGISVTSLVVDHILGRRNRIPRHVRVLLTTHFHYSELMPLSKLGSLEVVAVPIEASSEMIKRLSNTGENFVLLETEKEMAEAVADDARGVLQSHSVESMVTDNIQKALSDILLSDEKDRPDNPTILLSPRDWGSIDQKWREHPRVRAVEYQIRSEAWELIADVVGMPLGTLG